MNTEAQKWPFDIDAMKKGDTVPDEAIAKWSEKKRDDPNWSFILLQFKGYLEKELMARGEPYPVIASHDGKLTWLTDAEAVPYLEKRGYHTIRAFLVTHRKTLGIDTTQLTEELKHEHERIVYVQGKFVQAIKNTRKELALEAHQRKTPGLPEAI